MLRNKQSQPLRGSVTMRHSGPSVSSQARQYLSGSVTLSPDTTGLESAPLVISSVTRVEGTASIGHMKFPQQRAGSPEEWWKRVVFLRASVQN